MNSLKKNPRIAHVSLANKIIISHTVAKEGQAIYSVQAVGGFPDMVVCGWVNNSDIKKEMLAVQENQRKALEQARQYRINREETLRIEREARELAEQRREQEAKEEETKKVAVSLNEGEQI
jgi:hypothetical protein